MGGLLPQELFEHIIDQCADDDELLRRLSLIAKLFVSRTRTHLFRTYRVATDKSCQRFLLFHNTSLASYIRELHISTFIGVPITERLASLQSLSFSDILYLSDPFVQTVSRAGSVQSITFCGQSLFVRDTDQLFKFLHQFTNLRTVECWTSFQFRQWLPVEHGDDLSCLLEKATVHFNSALRQLLNLRPDFLRPEHLVLEVVTQDDMRTVREMVEVMRGTLKSLSSMLVLGACALNRTLTIWAVHFAKDFEPEEIETPLDISEITVLRCDVGSPDSLLQAWWIRCVMESGSGLERLEVGDGFIGVHLCLLLAQRHIAF